MTSTTSSTPSAPPSQPSGGNAAARASSGSTSSARHEQKPRQGIDLFSNLLGLMGAAVDAPSLLGASLEDATDALSNSVALDVFGNPLTSGSANPLADLIGWKGASSVGGSALGNGTDTLNGAQGGEAIGTNLGAATAGNGKAGALDGMTVLAQPVEADAGLLAQLKLGAKHPSGGRADSASTNPAPADSANTTIDLSAEGQAAQPASAVRNNILTASRPANWRSTATLGPSNPAPNAPASSPTGTATLQAAQNFTAQAGRDLSATLPLRSMAGQGERFSASIASEVGASGLALTGGAQSRSSQNDPSSSGKGETAFGTGQMADVHDIDGPEEAFSLENALAQEDPTDPNEQLGLQQLRHASVRIGEGTDEAIDIRLALQGDTVNVNFRTDNAEVRAGLQQQAGESLADMLQRSGLQLSGVSVDAHSQNGAGQPGNPGQRGSQSNPNGSSSRGITGASREQGPSRAAPERTAITRRADGGPALDVFA